MSEKCPACGRKLPKPKEQKPETDLQRVESLYIESFTKASWNKNQEPPKMKFARDRKAIKDMISTWGVERILMEIPVYLRTEDTFLKKLGYSIYGLECFIKGRMAGGYDDRPKNGSNGGTGRTFTEQRADYNRSKYNRVFSQREGGIRSGDSIPHRISYLTESNRRRIDSMESRTNEVSCSPIEDTRNISWPLKS